MHCRFLDDHPSFPRRESRCPNPILRPWSPAFAGMTGSGLGSLTAFPVGF